MEIKITKKDGGKRVVNVKASSAEMMKFYEDAYKALSPSVSLPGFRAGKAPRSMIIEAIGAQKLANEAIQQALREGYVKALSEHKLSPLGNPNIKINKQPSFIEGADSSLEFEIEVDVLPEVKFTKDYKKIKLSPVKQKTDVSDKEVEGALKLIANKKADLKAVKRGAKNGDKVEITFQGYLPRVDEKGRVKAGDGHVAVEKLSSQNHPIILGNKTLIPGFEDKILGMKKGEKKDFKIRFPKDYHAKDVAGKEFRFEVTVNNVEEVIAPKLDDEFAKSLGAKNMDDLKKLIRANLEQEKKMQTRQVQEDELVRELAKITRADLPEVLVESETQRLRKLIEDMAGRQGQSFEQYLKSVETTPEKFSKDISKQAATNVLIGLGLRKIAQDEKINIGKEESLSKVVHWLIDQVQK